jgi:ribonuclease P protein component
VGSNSRLPVLRNRSDFLFILKNGQRIKPCDWLVINFVKKDSVGPSSGFRCGWTIPGNVASSVVRNRLKRWSRVYCRRQLVDDNAPPADVNFVFRKMPTGFYQQLQFNEFIDALDRGWEQIHKRLHRSASRDR